MEKKRKNSLVLNSYSRATNIVSEQVSQSLRHRCEDFTGSPTRRGSGLGGGYRKHIKRDGRTDQAPRRVRVLDDDGNNVTPLPLYHAETGDTKSKPGSFFLDEIFSSSGSDNLKSTSSFNVLASSSFMGSSRLSSLCTTSSLTKLTEENLSKVDIPINPPATSGSPLSLQITTPSANIRVHGDSCLISSVDPSHRRCEQERAQSRSLMYSTPQT
ncbi:uncharacterized protein LOC115009439 [Cottoperca gobio]|uniref:Uncharacterized protein LOC115009439 n=1 Tax=Cottoperca gobio TaxID=56716 RepID=A0A6J2PUN7_COTGO|nr:uncharacterized protein LOC115009439 [Cottoperca gobio]